MKASLAKRQISIGLTKSIPHPTYYVTALDGKFAHRAFNEERAPTLKGKWRQNVFAAGPETPLDLEIGTGNGHHFTHRGLSKPHRYLVGLELKYKPLVQSIRRALKQNCHNVCMARYDGRALDHLFEKGEINNVYIHFPDPWPKRRQNKHRLIQAHFLEQLFKIQKSGGFVEFKTDNQDYFEKAVGDFKKSSYELASTTNDLYASQWTPTNFITHFEKIFTSQGLPIYHAILKKH